MSLCKPMFVAIGCLAVVLSALSADSGLGKLEGRWSGKRTASNGQEITQVIDIKGDKLTVQILNADYEVRLFATGKVKTEMVGPFKVLKISGIEAGRSASETQVVDDDRSTIYEIGRASCRERV